MEGKATGQKSTPRERPESAKKYEVARDEELRRLELQRAEVEGIRARTAQFLAFVGAGTAFLVGSSLSSSDRDLVFYLIAGGATLISAFTIMTAISVFVGGVRPKRRMTARWSFTLRPGTVLRAVESDIEPTESQLNAYLARLYAKMADENLPVLNRLRLQYLTFLSVGSAQLLSWVSLLWVRG